MLYLGEPQINDLPLKVCDNKLKLFSNATTEVTTIEMPEIPLHKFNFKPFGYFLKGNFKVDRLYITILHWISSNTHLTFQQLLTYFYFHKKISLVFFTKLWGPRLVGLIKRLASTLHCPMNGMWHHIYPHT